MRPAGVQRLAVFGYGFHFAESVRAILATSDVASHDELAERIAPLLKQPSAATRLRLAQKIVQRYYPRGDVTSPSLQLVRGLRQTDVQRELLFYQLTKTDALVGALARSLFHKHFVARKPPAGFTREEFRVMNAGGELMPLRQVISADFAVAFARRTWEFNHPTAVRRALHVLEEAHVLQKARLTELKRHPLAYSIAPRGLSLPAFLYCLHDEFGLTRGQPIALKRIARARFARTFVLWPQQVKQLANAAARHKFVELRRSKTSTSLRLVHESPEKFVEVLLARFGTLN